jgi:acyl-CoA thioesterase FadM
MVWAALDCPSIWAVGEFPERGFNVLARQRVESLAPVPVGEPSIVTAWPIEHDGRKHLTGVAIHDADGRLLARGESLLVEVPRRE